MTLSPFRNFIFGSVFGFTFAFVIAAAIGSAHQRHALAAAPDPEKEPQKKCAEVIIDGKDYGTVRQEGWDFAQKTIELQHASIERLKAELAEAKANPAAQMLAQFGHVMNEEQCRAWLGILAPPQSAVVSTVLYESGRASVNLSLLPLPGTPRIALNPNSQLAPRWIIPGRIQPQMIGETRQAMYYYFDATSSQWQGPFAPERAVQ